LQPQFPAGGLSIWFFMGHINNPLSTYMPKATHYKPCQEAVIAYRRPPAL